MKTKEKEEDINTHHTKSENIFLYKTMDKINKAYEKENEIELKK